MWRRMAVASTPAGVAIDCACVQPDGAPSLVCAQCSSACDVRCCRALLQCVGVAVARALVDDTSVDRPLLPRAPYIVHSQASTLERAGLPRYDQLWYDQWLDTKTNDCLSVYHLFMRTGISGGPCCRQPGGCDIITGSARCHCVLHQQGQVCWR